LALYYRWVLERIEKIRGREIEVLHIVGGGTQNELLCQFTADALGKPVVTGPVEATASGNIIMQAIAQGELGSLAEGCKLVANSFETKHYEPKDTDRWQKRYTEISKVFGT
jgi:rhamnulokinase